MISEQEINRQLELLEKLLKNSLGLPVPMTEDEICEAKRIAHFALEPVPVYFLGVLTWRDQ